MVVAGDGIITKEAGEGEGAVVVSGGGDFGVPFFFPQVVDHLTGGVDIPVGVDEAGFVFEPIGLFPETPQ